MGLICFLFEQTNNHNKPITGTLLRSLAHRSMNLGYQKGSEIGHLAIKLSCQPDAELASPVVEIHVSSIGQGMCKIFKKLYFTNIVMGSIRRLNSLCAVNISHIFILPHHPMSNHLQHYWLNNKHDECNRKHRD